MTSLTVNHLPWSMEEFARQFGGPSAVIGRHATAERWPALRIIGVARTIRMTKPTDTPHPQLFRLARGPAAMTIVVRVTGQADGRAARGWTSRTSSAPRRSEGVPVIARVR